MENEEPLDVKNIILERFLTSDDESQLTEEVVEPPLSRVERTLLSKKRKTELNKERRRNESPETKERRLQKQREIDRKRRTVNDDEAIDASSTDKTRLRRQKKTVDQNRYYDESLAAIQRNLQKRREYQRRRRAGKTGVPRTAKKPAASTKANASGPSWVPSKKSSMIPSIKPKEKERVYRDSNFCRFCLEPVDDLKAKSIPKLFLEIYEKHFGIEVTQ